jgi:membrane peptidoglycan carboxypeptidase
MLKVCLALVTVASVVVSSAWAGASLAWIGTPPGSDLQQRVEAIARAHHVTVVDAAELPPLLVDALVATEDERFWRHHGVDGSAVGRALLYDAVNGCACQGGSTITEQLVKNVYLGGSDLGVNKAEDMALALKVEARFSKQQILADYLTVVPFGNGLWGADTAACAYFGRHLPQLDLSQDALLAGMPRAPGAYDPRYHLSAAKARRDVVLAAMTAESYATPTQARAAAVAPVVQGPGNGCA